MSKSYMDKYEILEKFKQNEYQKILIGSNKENSDEVVVINILPKRKFNKTISISQVQRGLNNLIHIEDSDNEMIIVTEYNEGTPLDSYLDYFNTTLKYKINLAYEYLSKIIKYDVFNNSVKNIFVDESQIIIKEDILYFNELLIFDPGYDEVNTFSPIAKKIGSIIEQIIFKKEPKDTNSIENTKVIESIRNFISSLNNGENNYKSIQDIYNDFRKIYIYDLYMEDEYKIHNKNVPSDSSSYIPSLHSSSDPKYSDDMDNESLDENINGDNIDKHDEEVILEEGEDKNSSDTEDISMNIDRTSEEKELPNHRQKNYPKEILIGYEEVKSSNQDLEDNKKSKSFLPKILIAAALIGALLYGVFGLDLIRLNSEPTEPVAYFEIDKKEDKWNFLNKSSIYGDDNEIKEVLWEIFSNDKVIKSFNTLNLENLKFNKDEEYKITLKIKDKYDRWSQGYSEVIYNENLKIDELQSSIGGSEKLDKLDLRFADKAEVNKDYSFFRKGGKFSLKIEKEGINSSETINIEGVNTKNKPMISFWIATSTKDTVDLSIKGYKSNNLVFDKSLSHSPKAIKTWEMIQLSNTSKNIDSLEITLSNYKSPIWIDDIDIGTYK